MDAATVFKALSDETRRRILQLVLKQELSVSELVECLSQPQSTVSRHLKVLRDASLIRDRREGTTVLYTAPEVRVNGSATGLQDRILDWLGHESLGGPLDERLRRVLADRKRRSTNFFADVADRWDQMRVDAFGSTFHLEALVRLLPREWVVADIGAGTGFLLPVLAETFHQVIAVDPVSEMLDAARDVTSANGHRNVTFRQGDLSHVPISDASVDLVVAVLVLHHVPSVEEAVGEIARILKPGGRVLIVEQQSHGLAEFHERMQDRWMGFEPSVLESMLKGVGFDPIHVRRLPTCTNDGGKVEAPELFTVVADRVGMPIRTTHTHTQVETNIGRHDERDRSDDATVFTMEID